MRVLLLALTLALAVPASGQTRYTWTGGSSGDWTEAGNWSPNGVPAATDTAAIGPSNNAAILTANTTVAGLEITGLGVVAGSFDLTITDHLQWEGGGTGWETFRGTGTITIPSGATAHFAEGTPRYQMAPGRILVNDGSILWDGSGTWQGGGKLVNNGELLLAMSERDITFSDFADAITNRAGGLVRRAGPGAATIGSGFVNDGLVRVESGTLDLSSFNATGTTGTGSIEVQNGAELLISGRANGTQASITGETVTIDTFGGRFTVTDTYDVTTTHMTGNGTFRLDADATISDLVMEAGVLEGSGTVTVTGSMTWTGGSMAGTGTTTLGPSVALDLSGTQVRVSGSRTLRLEGPTTWTGEADIGSGTSTSTIINAGTMTSSGAGERLTNFVQFRNEGTITHDGGTLRFQGPMSNTGEVRVEDGTFTLQFASTGTDTGRYEIGDTGRLQFESNSRILAENAEIVGTGTATMVATVVNRATWAPGASPGTLTIDSDLPAPAPEAVLDVEIGGATAGTDFDQIVVDGEAALGGTLKITLLDGFTPALGDRFQIIAASGGATGAFDALDLPDGLEAFVDVTEAGADLVIGRPVSNGDGPALPDVLALGPPLPNPASGPVALDVALPEAGPVRVVVYDALGREVAVLVDREMPAGTHTVRLGEGLAPGVYVVSLGAGTEAVTQTLTLLR